MQETAQITTALRYLPWGKHVALLTDGRFSGFSSGACVGHIGPEALHGGPIGRVRDDDLIEIVIDRGTLAGSVDLVGAAGQPLDAAACAALLEQRTPHPGLAPHAALLERSEEHTSELQSRLHLECRLLLEKKKRRLTESQSHPQP